MQDQMYVFVYTDCNCMLYTVISFPACKIYCWRYSFMFSFHSLCSRISTQTATAPSHVKSLSVSGITSLISASSENSIKISKFINANF